VVLVQAKLASLGGVEALASGGPVVEIKKHRWVVGHRAEQFAEAAEEVRTDRLPLVRRDHPPHRSLVRRDVEVVEPEVDQGLLELAAAFGGADESGGDELRGNLAGTPELVESLRFLTGDISGLADLCLLRPGISGDELGGGER